MSNYLAIAAVTASLNYVINQVFQAEFSAAGVTTVRPDAISAAAPGVNIFLYQTMPSAAWRNGDVPTRDASDQLVGRPRAGLDLHYLLSFYGDETLLEPQRVMGLVTRTLHTQPVLTRGTVTSAVGAFGYVGGSDLASDIEVVRVTPIPMNLEELSKLWAIFPNTQYYLSAAYMASVVLIEALETPVYPLPVKKPVIYVTPINRPVIDSVTTTDAVQPAPIVSTSTLSIRGHNLKAAVTQVRLNGLAPVAPAAADITAGEVKLAIPPALAAGLTSVQILQLQQLGMPPTLAVQSNLFPIAYQPTVGTAVLGGLSGPPANRTGDITINVAPVLQKAQRVTVMINATPGPGAYSVTLAPLAAAAGSVVAHFTGVVGGPYSVRIEVDGAVSPVGPTVTF